MRIAIITSTYPRFRGDGVGSFIHSLSQALVQHGHHLTVLAPYDPDVTPGWPNEVKVKRVHYIWPKSWAIVGHARSLASDVRLRWHAYPLAALFALSATLHLYREVRHQQTDIIYAQWLLPGGFIGAIVSYLTGIPLVVSLHGSDVFLVERYPAFRPVARFVLHKACHVIACSTDLARRVLRLGLSSESVSVIPYGVDHKRFTPLAPKAKLPVPNNHHIVMAIGRLVRKKGFSFLLEAAPLVLARHPDVHFVIAGDGDLKEELRNLAVSLKIQEHVLFTGYIPWDHLPSYMVCADVIVVPSVRDEAGNLDGLPNVLLESMASGRAIVATEVAGIPEVIKNEENGLLIPPKNTQALAKAISLLLEKPHLRHQLGEAARRTVVSGMTWAHVGTRIANTLQLCIRSRKT